MVQSAPVYAGQRILVEGEFRLRGVPTDPTVIRFLARGPDGGLVQVVVPDESIVHVSTGVYEASVLVDVGGIWKFRWEGAGIVDAVAELGLDVRPSDVVQ